MDTDKIELKTLMETAAVADYLTALAKGFKSGSIVVEKDGESLTLTPAETAEVEVEARMKKDKMRFSLEVTWRVAQAQDEPSSLKISATAPKKCEKDDDCDTAEKTEKKTEKKPEPAKAAAPAPAKAPEAKPAMVKVIESHATTTSKAPEAKGAEAKPADAHKPSTFTSKP